MEKEQGPMEVDESQQETGSAPFVSADSRLFGERHSTEVTDVTQPTTADASATSEPRGMPVAEYVCDRFAHASSHVGTDNMWWKCIGDADAVDFKVDRDFKVHRDITIVGAGFYPARKEVPWKVSVALLERDGAALTSVDASFDGDGTTQIKTVRFPESVKVLIGKAYTIKADITSPSEQSKYNPFKTHYGVNGRKIVKVETQSGDVQFTFSMSALSTNNTEPGVGQIPHILFTV